MNLNIIYSYYLPTQTIQNYLSSIGLPVVNDMKNPPKDNDPEVVWKNNEHSTEIQWQKTLQSIYIVSYTYY